MSDDANNLQKWNFPDLSLSSQEYVLIIASGNPNSTSSASWSTIIRKGDSWKYFLGNSEPSNQWKDVDFNDDIWNEGNSGIGYGDGDDVTIIPATKSLYLRKSFILDDLNTITDAFLSIDVDDGFVAYLNGEEIGRFNLGSEGEYIPYNRYSDEASEASLYRGEKLKAFHINDVTAKLILGENVLSIQVHNANATSSDMTAIPFLTLGYNNQQNNNGIADEVQHLIPNIHCNFSISNGNESIYLSNISGTIIDSIEALTLPPDVSYGRNPNDINSWLLFDIPTPGSENAANGFVNQLDLPMLNLEPGFYSSQIQLELVNNKNYSNYYTTDGSEPTENSTKFENAISIQKSSVIKIKSFSSGWVPSSTNTYTYLVGEQSRLPVISLSTNPTNLWDFNTGIYVKGPNAESNFPFFNANFWQDWERTATFEMFDRFGERQIYSDVNFKIFGGWSRAYEQRSISAYAEKGIDDGIFNYRIFPRSKVKEYKSIVLRNSGNDWNSTMMRDAFMQSLAENLNVEYLNYEPSILFLNGEYWGIHNIREKINLNYINAHHGVNKDSVDLLELNGEVIDGENSDYIELIEFLNSNSLANDANYQHVKSKIDIKNLIDYYCIQIYIANTDWPGNNNKFWKKSGESGKWRWILFDTDFGFGWINSDNYRHNTISFASSSNGPPWPNPPWSTLIIRKLFENDSFVDQFVIRFSDLLNSVFLSGNVLAKIDYHKNLISDEIPRHGQKWNQFTPDSWESNIEIMNIFAQLRPTFVYRHLKEKFDLSDLSKINIELSQSNAGKIKINSIIPTEYPWNGEYFSDSEIMLLALPNPGYIFAGWNGSITSSSDTLFASPTELSNVTANFIEKSSFKDIVINEINYNSSPDFDTKDWIEIYNNSSDDYDLSYWVVKDGNDNNIFRFTANTIVPANNYLVICRDTNSFKSNWGSGFKIIGDFDFKLNNSGELIRLYDNNLNIVDSVRYTDYSPWPSSADGSGNTLELLNPELDNSIAKNWSNSYNFGSPGLKNSSFAVDIKNEIPIVQNFALSNNYPNPFNPTTVINYSVPANTSDKIKIQIFDILGRQIKTLVNRTHTQGHYKVVFDAKNLPTGIYFYKLTSLNWSETKKMILLK